MKNDLKTPKKIKKQHLELIWSHFKHFQKNRFLELHWTPGNILQAEDRAHRIGQTNNVNITYLVSKGDSIDMKIWDMLARKQQFLGCKLSRKAWCAAEDTLSRTTLTEIKQSCP